MDKDNTVTNKPSTANRERVAVKLVNRYGNYTTVVHKLDEIESEFRESWLTDADQILSLIEPKVLTDEELCHVVNKAMEEYEDIEMTNAEWELTLWKAISQETIDRIKGA